MNLATVVSRPDDMNGSPGVSIGLVTVLRFGSRALLFASLVLLGYGLVWNYSTRTYLKGFVDAIIPLQGSDQEKTEALLDWFHHEPQRGNPPAQGAVSLLDSRDPVSIVQNARLLSVCGTSSNAFMNLAIAAGLRVRRLLLLDSHGVTVHVVAEVRWDGRWVVVNPQQGLIFKDKQGRGLTKEDLRDPVVFQDAISKMPGYPRAYNFEHTIHIRLSRIPIAGRLLRKTLDRILPGWEEAINWTYLPENPSLWLIFISIPLLLTGIVASWVVGRYAHRRHAAKLLPMTP